MANINMDEEIVLPIAFHQASIDRESSLIDRLSYELISERERSSILTSQLIQERAKNSELQGILDSLQPKIPRIQSWGSICTAADLPEDKIGTYSKEVRWEKIQKYKLKQRKYREKVNISRQFRGRSNVAKSKPRVNGKFVKANL